MILAEYDADGRITNLRFPPFEERVADRLRALGVRILEVDDETPFDFGTHYVTDGALAARPEIVPDGPLTLALGAVMTIEAGQGARLLVDGEEIGVSADGSIELEASQPGLFEVRIFPPWPAQDVSLQVTVSA